MEIWQVDSEKSGLEKAFCCIGSNARDFAKFGLLINHEGKYNQQQLIPSSFIQKITTPRFENSPQYGYGYWLDNYKGKKSDLYARDIRPIHHFYPRR